jgi:DNA-binding winged helix-turn-helix (wHTH) protein
MRRWLSQWRGDRVPRSQPIRFGSAALLFDSNLLRIDGRATHLEPKQTQVLAKLLAEAPRVVSKDELIDCVWRGLPSGDDVLVVAVSHLRKALDDSAREPNFIKTVSGEGYQLIAGVSRRDRDLARCLINGEQAPEPELTSQPRRPAALAAAAVALVLSTGLLIHRFSPEGVDPVTQAAELLQSEAPEDWPAALAGFETAYSADPTRIDAVLGMVDAQWRILADRPLLLYQARKEIAGWLQRAAELEPERVDVHTRLARLAFLVDWDFIGAEQHYRRALELAPDDADIHFWLSQLQLAMGDFDAASASLEHSRALDPRLFAVEMAAWVYNMQRRYDRAQLELERLVAVRPDTLNYHVSAQSVFENAGDHDRSFQHLMRVLELRGYDAAAIRQAKDRYQDGGLAGVYGWLLNEREETRNIGQYRPPLSFARYAITAGDHESALRHLDAALAARQYELLWINVDPKYDPIRTEPEFAALVQSISPVLVAGGSSPNSNLMNPKLELKD